MASPASPNAKLRWKKALLAVKPDVPARGRPSSGWDVVFKEILQEGSLRKALRRLRLLLEDDKGA